MDYTNLTDHFLIAMPTLQDPNFHQTVTYVCVHNEEGAMGIVINRPMAIGLNDVLEQMGMPGASSPQAGTIIYDGGPVQRDRGFVIHQPAGEWDSVLPVNDTIAVSTSRDILSAIANGTGPDKVLIALGYAGWSAGQLEAELIQNAWLSAPADRSILFNTEPELRWQAAAASISVDLNQISGDVGHA